MTAADHLPDRLTLESLREAAKRCRGCDLWQTATQTVFGAGPADADLMFVGEQPGDQEDRLGEPFVGPAGRIFDQALREIGIERSRVYVTNAVKHFKWQPRGKRRIHQKPNAAELATVQPRVLVCLGATAAQALLGRAFRVTKQRGTPVESPLASVVVATIHPSAVLRARDRDAEYAGFVADLERVAALL